MDISQLLTFAIDNGASQVIVSAGTPPVLRVQGKLVPTKMPPLAAHDTRDLVFSLLDESQQQVFQTDREIHFPFSLRHDRHFLGSVYQQRGCISAIFDIVPQAVPLPAKLGLPSFVADAARSDQGLILIASPPGHGKSLTVSSLLELINSEREAIIITIEEMIVHPHLNKKSVVHQRAVGQDTTTFSSALTAAMGQDPDVLVVDPVSDGETFRKMLAFAGRGHLVIASMEAEYVMEAVERFVLGPDPADRARLCRQLGSALLLVAAIRLLARKDGAGRVAATELLKVDAEIGTLIRNARFDEIASRMAGSQEAGIWTMDSFIRKLLERELVADETARRYLLDTRGLERT
jgi:twitching motility protein PilT